MALLTWEDGVVKIDGQELPGLLVDQAVDCKVKFDEQQVDGRSGKKRTPLGWEDTEVKLTLILLTDDESDCYEKLEKINGIFRGHDGQANPKVYDVDNRHLQARGVGKLIFSELSSSETDQDDTIAAQLALVENNPPVVKTEKQVAKAALDKAKGEQDEAEAQAQTPAVKLAPDVEIDLAR